jgi:hypothetical protein
MVKESLQNALQKYEKVCQQFKKFFNAEDLGNLIDTKCATKKVERLLKPLALQTDVENCLKVVQTLFDRIQQMSIL